MKLSKRDVRYPWVWPADAKDGDENSVTFQMRLIPHSARVAIKDSMVRMGTKEDEGTHLLAGTMQDKKLEAAIVGWSNMLDDEANAIEFSKTAMHDVLDHPDLTRCRADILAHIDEMNGIDIDTEKNS